MEEELMNKKIITIILVLVVVFSSALIILNINTNTNKKETIVRETVNLDDGLQKEELENLKIEDYNKINMPDIDNLNLDEVDSYYYLKMWDSRAFKENATREEREKIYLYFKDKKAAILEMCKKNGDWSLIINNNRYGEYNQKDGLLKDFNYKEIETVDYVETSGYDYVDIVAKNDKEERKYRISFFIQDGLISDINVKLGEVKSLKRNEEKDLNKLKFDKEHTKDNFINLGMYEEAYRGGLDWYGEDIGITDNFYEKYPYFLDIFIHYSPLEYNKITLKELDIDNQIATFEVDSILECKRRTYDVKYELDNDLYLDDVKVELLNVNAYVGNKDERTNKVLYRYSNWDNLNLTVNFLDKYNSDVGLLPNIDEINIDIKIKEAYISSNDYYQYIYNLKAKDNTNIYYYVKFECDKKGNIDDIIFEKLNFNSSMTLEEVRNAYIRDYVEKK